MLPDERTTLSNRLELPTEVEALVVAPGRGVARPVVTFLRQQGIHVRTADEADSAFEEALMHPPDVIFVDDRIVPAGGVELCQRLKSNVRTHFVPTILLTINDLRQSRLRALAAGADAVFSPSTDAQERRTRLWALLRTRALHRQLERKQRNQGTEIVERRRWLAYLLHDLQGSVSALRANVDFMARFGPPADDRRRSDFDDSVEDARTVFDQLMHSVRTVVDFDRLESGQLALDAVPIRIGELATAVERELERNVLVREKGLEVVLPIEEPPISVDRELMHRVMLNLVTHCLRRGEGRTIVRITPADAGVRVWIGASGTTPPVAEQREMFEPYAQLGEKPVGYGLGLAMARAVVELQGGKIWVEEIPGGGMAFVMTLGGPPPPARSRPSRRRSRG